MATTRLIAIRVNKGKSIASTLKVRVNYPLDSEKTKNKKVAPDNPIDKIIFDSTTYATDSNKTSAGELVKSYECDKRTVDMEFLLAKKEYEYITGRNQGERNVLAYHIRQSFAPGEIEPEKALEIGYELAMRFTKGEHAFIVATHTNSTCVHSHIIFNSTALNHRKKFRDFKRSGLALQKISDLLCLENGLSVIENPKPSKGRNYHKWLAKKEPSQHDQLRQKIDEVLPTCATFEDFLSSMRTLGYEVNDKRKHITVKSPEQKKPVRLNTLKDEYTEEAIKARIANKVTSNDSKTPTIAPLQTPQSTTIKVSWLIDIESKIREGNGTGYEQWATIFNLKESAKTLLYLREQGIDSYEELAQKSSILSQQFSETTSKLKTIEARQKEISELQRQIGTYGKTRDIYIAYKRSGYNSEFYETNRSSITLHETAKKHFDNLGIKKLPKMSELKQEYATLRAEKKRLYTVYHEMKKQNRELLVAKHNTARLLGISTGTSDAKTPESLHSKMHTETPNL